MDKITVLKESSVPAEIISKIEAILQESGARLVAQNGRIELDYGNATYWIKDTEGGGNANDLPRLWDSQRLVTSDY